MSTLNSKCVFRAVYRQNPTIVFYVRENTNGRWDKYSALVLHEPVVLVGMLKEKKYIVYPVSFAFFDEDWIVMLPTGVNDVNKKTIYECDIVEDKDGNKMRVVKERGAFYAGLQILTPELVKERQLKVVGMEVNNERRR